MRHIIYTKLEYVKKDRETKVDLLFYKKIFFYFNLMFWVGHLPALEL